VQKKRKLMDAAEKKRKQVPSRRIHRGKVGA
jgi:hypothetical protein